MISKARLIAVLLGGMTAAEVSTAIGGAGIAGAAAVGKSIYHSGKLTTYFELPLHSCLSSSGS